MNPWPEIFIDWRPHWSSEALGSDYQQYHTAGGLDGLARVDGDTLNILFIGASNPGTGQFRAFVTAAKARFSGIVFWSIWNPKLEKTLERYGFTPCTGPDTHLDGTPSTATGMRWLRAAEQAKIS